MIRESCHLHRFAIRPFCLAAFSKGNAKNLGCFSCILLIGLIEITDTEQQKSIWMFALQIQELFHQGRKGNGSYSLGFCFGRFLLGLLFLSFFLFLLRRITAFLFLLVVPTFLLLMKFCAINFWSNPFFRFFELSGKDIRIKGCCQMLFVVLFVICQPQALPLFLIDISRFLLLIADCGDKENL